MPYATVTWQWLKVWHGSNSCISRDSKYFYSQLIYANKRTLEGYSYKKVDHDCHTFQTRQMETAEKSILIDIWL
jgi:hypothetical protein